MRVLRLTSVILLMLVTAACAAYHREFDANLPFAPHFSRNFDVEVAWQSVQTGSILKVAGSVTNRRYAFLQDFELTAKIFDQKGALLASETSDSFPNYIPSGKSEPFAMTLTLPDGATPTRLSFHYDYFLKEEPPVFRGYGESGDTPHFGTFDAPL